MEQQIAVSEKLNPNRIPREPFGIKARSTLNRITLTPSKASPNETLYVDIPKLANNIVIVPGSVYLTFVLNVTGHRRPSWIFVLLPRQQRLIKW